MIARLRLVAFDLRHGLPTAARVLRRELPPEQARRAIRGVLRRSLTVNPFAGLDEPRAPRDEKEALSRHQLAPLLHLDATLREDLGLSAEEAMPVLRAVVAETGARFVGTVVRFPARARWEGMGAGERRAFVDGLVPRFFNATAHVVPPGTDGAELGFDVSACHFVVLTRRLGRPELAPLFCAADSVFFGSERSPVALDRPATLADGAARCAFRFHWKDGDLSG